MPNGNVLMVVTDRKNQNIAVQAGRDSSLIVDGNIRSLSIIEVKQTGLENGAAADRHLYLPAGAYLQAWQRSESSS